jgi:predicted nucleic acid-binding protein
MKPTVYVETSVISYLTAWPSRDVVLLGHQQETRQWWADRQSRFDLYTSQLVLAEAAQGDPSAAAERLNALGGIPLVELTDTAEVLADRLVRAGALPTKARLDALHLAISATNGIDYLLTWNCRHLANAMMRKKMEAECMVAGYDPPLICTVTELLEERP